LALPRDPTTVKIISKGKMSKGTNYILTEVGFSKNFLQLFIYIHLKHYKILEIFKQLMQEK
jgi:hypothetical protein